MGERNFYNIDNRIISTPSRDLSPEEKAVEEEDARQFMRELSESAAGSFVGELIKTDAEKAVIYNFNKYIRESAAELGVEEIRKQFPLRNLHVVLPEGYKKRFPDDHKGNSGRYLSITDAIFTKRDKDINRLQLAHIIGHEMIHSFSANRYDFDSDWSLTYNKLGYRSSKVVKSPVSMAESGPIDEVETEEITADLFLGFNEAITDLMAKEMIEKHQPELLRTLDIKEDELDQYPLNYYGYCPMIEWIMDKIAEKNGEDWETVWKKFKLGLLTGKMMHLREIERTLGPGSLRLVANLGNSKEDNQAFRDFMENYDKNK